ncbi:cell division/cell wall cluster transcriptional repressor MraZ [Limimaricola sp.]|uniref:division/cell wall cluster transcriptional repressor MraZ n=1 Tax=Limimaricola sp. TaxID=2211665 RepID=UPI0025B7CA28|nr:cell division/cell wall cluster transcriptional repressor MraZ [Limimaricola sp.]
MVLSFTGEHQPKVDGKGRMSIPADFRRVLERGDPDWTEGLSPKLMLLYGDHLRDTLHVYTVEEFGRIVASIYAMPASNPNKRRLSHLIIGQSIRLEVDKDGRVVLPIKQRQKLGMGEGELYVRGVGDHFEIWKAETFENSVGAGLQDWLDEQGEDFDPLGLIDGT